MFDLTPRQKEILQFIRDHHSKEGFWPSIRDVQAHFGFKSTNGVFGHLRALERKRALVRSHGQARAFRVVGMQEAPKKSAREAVVELPVYGSIAAGYPDGVESGNAVERLQVNVGNVRRSASRRPFALRVRGESMIDAGINDGDTVVVDPRPPRDGDIVVALIDGQSTLKRLVRTREGRPFLQSENQSFPTMHPLTELVIQGVATALVRPL